MAWHWRHHSDVCVDAHGVPRWRLSQWADFSASIVVSSASAASNPKVKTVVVSTATTASLGTILVSGTPLYTLKAGKTPCGARCTKVWPQLVLPKGVKRARAGAGVSATQLGSVKRTGGARQVTYGGKALYLFVGDKTAGQVHGDVTDTWGTWSVVVMAPPPAPPSSPGAPAPSTPSTTTGRDTAPTTTTPTKGATPTVPLTTTPTTAPPPPTTATTPTTAPAPPTTTTTAPSSGGISF